MSVYKTIEWYIPVDRDLEDCETCGTPYEEVNVEFVRSGFEANYSVGCYGGGGRGGMNIDELVEWARELPDGFITAADERELLAGARLEWEMNNTAK